MSLPHDPEAAAEWPLLTPRTRLDAAIAAVVIVVTLALIAGMLVVEALGSAARGVGRAIAADIVGR